MREQKYNRDTNAWKSWVSTKEKSVWLHTVFEEAGGPGLLYERTSPDIINLVRSFLYILFFVLFFILLFQKSLIIRRSGEQLFINNTNKYLRTSNVWLTVSHEKLSETNYIYKE